MNRTCTSCGHDCHCNWDQCDCGCDTCQCGRTYSDPYNGLPSDVEPDTD
jgi:hypothetical protein